MKWWFCLIHQVVEEGAGCPDQSRLGPFENREQAQSVLARMHKRDEDADPDED